MAGWMPGYITPPGGNFDPAQVQSGSVTSGDLAFGIVFSGNIASGQVGSFHLSSGSVRSGHIGNAAVVSGSYASGSIAGLGAGGFAIASGTLSTYDLASGAVARASQFSVPIQSGTSWSILTEEPISGIKAAQISQSGTLRIAMASVSGRMPAVGAVFDNVASGIPANVYTHGFFVSSSGLMPTFGFFGQPMFVGRSGHITVASGFFASGGWASGDYGQKLGIALAQASGAVLLNTTTIAWSGGPLGLATNTLL